MRPLYPGLLAILALCGAAHAQDLEPRAYSNAPVGMNFLIAGYGHSEGNLLFDPSVPVEGASAMVDVGVFGFAHTLGIAGRSGKFAIVAPYAALDAQGLVNGEYQQRNVTGFADPTLAFSINFSGAPALNFEEFRRYRQSTIFGATFKVTVPVGQYDADRLLNIGTNRWSFRPEIGVSHAMGSWILEGSLAACWYETNDEFFRGQRLEQDPIYAAQAHVVYDIKPGLWIALDSTYYTGGMSTIDGVRKNNELHNWRLGLTLAIPVNRHHSIKLAASNGISTRTGTDFDAYLVAWQYRWGGGF
ncbi:MAG TPA: transporter [Povalibacter sp.]|nr:transporter [Povalibacter sp.]